jgi:CRP/FNR family transcriptional regulator, cyclic AMP receptor protein
MIEQFEGQEGKRKLVELMANQELVGQNYTIAQELAKVAKLGEYKKGQDVFIEGPSSHKLYFILSGAFDVLVKGGSIREVREGEAVGEFSSSIRAWVIP